jgi:glycosyltransferase involved in cell wall biosynthesis
MRIALVSTVSSSVHAHAGGSVESWTWLLAREFSRLGHAVTVFGCAGGAVNGEYVTTLPGPYGENGAFDDWQLCEWVNLCRAVEESARFDVMHCQAYLWGIPLQPLARSPMVHTLHIIPDDNAARLWRQAPGSIVTAISRHQWSAYPDLQPAAFIPHGVDETQFPFRKEPDDYLLYLGRFVSGKGPLHAIQIARALGQRLVLAGPESPYYREKIKPLVDGKSVQYVGFVRGAERSRWLGGARALLYPIQYPEAFGLVLVEAMFCGTPVAALPLGAVPEIIEDGVSGCLATSTAEMPATIGRCLGLDRARIRRQAEQRFSSGQMARAYLELYEKIAETH